MSDNFTRGVMTPLRGGLKSLKNKGLLKVGAKIAGPLLQRQMKFAGRTRNMNANLKRVLTTVVGCLSLGFVAGTSAAIIDFEDIGVATGVNSIGGDRVSGGFVFDSSTDHTHLINDNFLSFNGTTWLRTDGNSGATVLTMSQVGGGTFSLGSLDLTEGTGTSQIATTVRVTGFLSGGGSIMTDLTMDLIHDGAGGANDFQSFSFGSGWSSLSSVTFEATAGTGDRIFALDNIDAASAVSEPATLGLIGLSFVVLNLRRRRRV